MLETIIGAIAGEPPAQRSELAAQVLTRGKEVEVPAETVLSFQLQQPLQVRS